MVEQEYLGVPTGLEDASLPAAPADTIEWTASEFVAHEKSAGWYLLLAGAAVAAAGLVYLLTRDPVSSGVVIVAGTLLGVYGSHKPRQQAYRLNTQGLTIGSKFYPYSEFRSFAVQDEGAFDSIVFMPLKRFAVPINIYFAPDDEEKIVQLLAACLPFEQKKRDATDNLMRRIRF